MGAALPDTSSCWVKQSVVVIKSRTEGLKLIIRLNIEFRFEFNVAYGQREKESILCQSSVLQPASTCVQH